MNVQAHPTTIIAVDPESRQRSMIVEIHPEIGGEAPDRVIGAFERRMFDRNVRVGLIVTPAWTYVVRDLLKSMSFDDNEFDVSKVETPLLLQAATLGPPKTGGAFSRQVLTWLEAIAGAWSSFLPSEAVPAMVPEVIGNLAQAHFEQWDDVLEAGDAA
ncbi:MULTISPECIES: hypothetical protein [Sorangium]|uniref:Uncharacterized protein n=2 Tax=Sorangium cellulosum TaxID=56 RepID=A0A150QAV6_SORCE|nr:MULTISPECIES: hypothetical protein [Sorangium]AGP40135.1 hypothetical protein SCE1572_39930 [Sorangium cellulosum So0157-2]AUX35269.1 uncharacterized protein SOCE836_074590 [Sorangium cellulosum]KYF65117.1 hypothetical protein BE04_49465 [Sorangium cellulosum]WCQ94573.1 hypothetical protein NQZ70_07341 [Sorangium sp. Soce836]